MAKSDYERTDPAKIARARRQLWLTTFAILGSLALVLVFIAGSGPRADLVVPLGALRVALIGLLIGFVGYAIDRERNLHRLAGRLTQQLVDSARLAARLEYVNVLERERDTNAALLDGSADGIAVVDPDLRLVRFNAAMQELCALPNADAPGEYAPAVLRFADADGKPLEDADHPLARAIHEGALTGLELRLRLANGVERWVSGTFSPIRDGADGPVALVLVTARDISRQKEMELMQRDFVSIVSHELRTPLTAIKGFAKTLLQREDQLGPEARREYLATVNDQADRLARLVEDLLQVSKIDAQRLRIERVDVDVAQMVQSLAGQFASKWVGRTVLLDAPDSMIASADGRKVEEILINLMDNAVKYSSPPDPVTVRIRELNGMLECTVEDHGLGISVEDAAKLFQKFQRIASPATRDIGGTGLGLYIVKGLVEAQGGHCWVESAPGAGSTFGFTLPSAHAESFDERVEAGA